MRRVPSWSGLLSRRARAAERLSALVGHDLFRFQNLESNLLGPRQHRRRQPGEPSDFDSIRPIGASGLKAVQKQNLVAHLAHPDIIVANCY